MFQMRVEQTAAIRGHGQPRRPPKRCLCDRDQWSDAARGKSGRREPRGSRPPTPPDIRFRIRRFVKLLPHRS